MKQYFGYTRVSTVKQGDGVSLEAQREAVDTYAQKHNLTISTWFEEKETAAKRGRPVFNKVVVALQNGEAAGLIIHKIDRSARNFADWAKIGDLIDSGIDVRFAHESLDMQSRGGRLTADIQAVIAADYVRNLREECIKGIEGRLKQGLFPFGAPIGYLNQGKGKPKTHDPARAPYVRQAFELYATQQYSIRSLLAELNKRGFRTRSGKRISKGCLEILLNNKFYCGEIYVKRTGLTYAGVHEPIITKKLFKRVQHIKGNRLHKKQVKHAYVFRRLIRCGLCQHALYGEGQKSYVYMRCQTRDCPTIAIREDRLGSEIGSRLMALRITQSDMTRLEHRLHALIQKRAEDDDRKAHELQLAQLRQREDRLTDALIDQLIDKSIFVQRQQRLLEERQSIEKAIAEDNEIEVDKRMAEKFLELVKTLYLTYEIADPVKKRRIVETAFSNCTLSAKNLYLQPQKWLLEIDWTLGVLCGGPQRDTSRTKEEIKTFIEELEE